MTGIPAQRTVATIRAELDAARTAQLAARDACLHSPNAQTIAAVNDAAAQINELLDDYSDALRAAP